MDPLSYLMAGALKQVGEIAVEMVIPPKLAKPDKTYELLCVEIGHHRCKVALVAVQSGTRTCEVSKSKKLEILPSEQFFGEAGFKAFVELLLNTQNDSPIKFDGLAISFCCPTNSKEGVIDTTHSLGWEQNIQEVLHQKTEHDCIVVVNDAVSFALGCQSDDQIANSLRLPILTITLGGAIGTSVIESNQPPYVKPFEAGTIWKVWENGFEGNPHMLAGEGFFDWARKETNWEVGEIKSNFSQRLGCIINAIKDQGIQFNSVIIGGGNAAYIDQFEVAKNIQKSYKLRLSCLPTVSLCGAANLWLEHFHYGQPMPNLVGTIYSDPK